MSTTYSDAEKTAYVNQALQKGFALADINRFLADNVNDNGESDYGRIISALTPQPSGPALLAPTAPVGSLPVGDLGAPSTPADGFLTAHLEIAPFGFNTDPLATNAGGNVGQPPGPITVTTASSPALLWLGALAAGIALLSYLDRK